MAELKPKREICYWCKNDKQDWIYVQSVDYLGEEMFQVRCHNCGARGPIECSPNEAIDAWNKRS